MKISKFYFLGLMFLLVGCSSVNTSNLKLYIPSPQNLFNANNQQFSIDVTIQDARANKEIYSIVDNGVVNKIFVEPNVNELFSQVMARYLNALGYRLENHGSKNLTVKVKKFQTDIGQGNLRYQMNFVIDVDVAVTDKETNRTFAKNFTVKHKIEGLFNAPTSEISKNLQKLFNELSAKIFADEDIKQALNQ